MGVEGGVACLLVERVCVCSAVAVHGGEAGLGAFHGGWTGNGGREGVLFFDTGEACDALEERLAFGGERLCPRTSWPCKNLMGCGVHQPRHAIMLDIPKALIPTRIRIAKALPILVAKLLRPSHKLRNLCRYLRMQRRSPNRESWMVTLIRGTIRRMRVLELAVPLLLHRPATRTGMRMIVLHMLIIFTLLFITMLMITIHNRMRNIPMQNLRHDRNPQSAYQETPNQDQSRNLGVHAAFGQVILGRRQHAVQ